MQSSSVSGSAFDDVGMDEVVGRIARNIQDLYQSDQVPWVVGYSGGKDSTASLQLVWNALSQLDAKLRTKPVYVISTDTLVENPVVAIWVENSLKAMQERAQAGALPMLPHRLSPDVRDRFWVNLVGKGYPAPRPKFRWCTSRLKISPSNKFITDIVSKHGEAILVLGTRKRESAARARSMEKYEKGSTREQLSRNNELDRVWVYSPIADWSNDNVWEYVCTFENPWGYDNNELLKMYRGATEGGECPLVVDTTTPSCGDSRFGCYVCTLVEKDKSMQAMIQNDDEKQWMMPLVRLRNKYLSTDDRDKRDFRRMNGTLMAYRDRLVHGPYKQAFREELLEALLRAQEEVREKAPNHLKGFEVISLEDLEEIRRIWVVEKNEIEDSLPEIYEKVLKQPYPGQALDGRAALSDEDIKLLREICAQDGDGEGIHFELLRDLLSVEHKFKTKVKRMGIFPAIDKALERGSYESASEAEAIARRELKLRGKNEGSVIGEPPGSYAEVQPEFRLE